MSPEELANTLQALTEQVAELQGRLASLDAHGLTALQGGTLATHPHLYSTTVPTTAEMGGDGQIRVIQTGGNHYIYVRSGGAIKRVQVT